MLAILGCETAELEPLRKALATLAVDPKVVRDATALSGVSKLIIPRVSSLPAALRGLRDGGRVAPLVRVLASGIPVLAIDSGYHLLFDVCHSDGQHTGLGVVPGRVEPINLSTHPAARHFTLPHQGWNQVTRPRDCPVMTGIEADEFFYFDHSLHPEPADPRAILGRSNHGVDFNALCGTGNIIGMQFIPERSKEAGLKMFANFLAI